MSSAASGLAVEAPPNDAAALQSAFIPPGSVLQAERHPDELQASPRRDGYPRGWEHEARPRYRTYRPYRSYRPRSWGAARNRNWNFDRSRVYRGPVDNFGGRWIYVRPAEPPHWRSAYSGRWSPRGERWHDAPPWQRRQWRHPRDRYGDSEWNAPAYSRRYDDR